MIKQKRSLVDSSLGVAMALAAMQSKRGINVTSMSEEEMAKSAKKREIAVWNAEV